MQVIWSARKSFLNHRISSEAQIYAKIVGSETRSSYPHLYLSPQNQFPFFYFRDRENAKFCQLPGEVQPSGIIGLETDMSSQRRYISMILSQWELIRLLMVVGIFSREVNKIFKNMSFHLDLILFSRIHLDFFFVSVHQSNICILCIHNQFQWK